MANNNKSNQNLMYIGGLLLLAFVLYQGGGMPFLGAFVTTCTNLELDSSDTVITYYSDGAVIRTIESVPYVTQIENATVTKFMTTVQIMTNETDMVMLSREDVSCSDFIKYIKTLETPVTDTLYYNQKVGTDFNGTLYWCNAANTLTFKGDRHSFMSYVDEFVICVIEDIPDAVEEDLDEDEEDLESFEDDVGTGDGSVSTTTDTNITTITYTEPIQDDISKNRTIFGVILVAIGLAAYYFGYEKGPKRGFIRK